METPRENNRQELMKNLAEETIETLKRDGFI